MRGKFDTPPILVQGHQTRESSTPQTLSSLWTISCVKLWKAQTKPTHQKLTKRKGAMPRLALHTERGTGSRKGCDEGRAATEDAQGAGSARNCAKKLWGKFRPQTEKRSFPPNLSPDVAPPPRRREWDTRPSAHSAAPAPWRPSHAGASTLHRKAIGIRGGADVGRATAASRAKRQVGPGPVRRWGGGGGGGVVSEPHCAHRRRGCCWCLHRKAKALLGPWTTASAPPGLGNEALWTGPRTQVPGCHETHPHPITRGRPPPEAGRDRSPPQRADMSGRRLTTLSHRPLSRYRISSDGSEAKGGGPALLRTSFNEKKRRKEKETRAVQSPAQYLGTQYNGT